MKKTSMLSGLTLAFLFLSAVVFAQAPEKTTDSKKCAKTQSANCNKSCTHQSCKGTCDPNNKGKNKDCTSFVDKDKNGICDNYSADKAGCCEQAKGKGNCSGHGALNGKGNCCGKTASPDPDKAKSK